MRLPTDEHRARPWVMERIAADFDLLDVWGLPVESAREDFDAFLDTMAAYRPTLPRTPWGAALAITSGALFAVRFALGRLFGWDDGSVQHPIPGSTETTLRARLPAELLGTGDSPSFTGGLGRAAGGFKPLFKTDDEWAAELSNATVHGVLQLTWVEQPGGTHRARLAVYVKARGRIGTAYMTLIQPFRHLVVYPALTRQIGRAWETRAARRSAA